MFVFSRVVQNYQTYKCQVWSNLPEKKVTHSLTLSFQCPPSSLFHYMNCHPQGCFGYIPPQKKGENTKQIFRVSSNLAWCSISPFKICDEHIYNWITIWEDSWWTTCHWLHKLPPWFFLQDDPGNKICDFLIQPHTVAFNRKGIWSTWTSRRICCSSPWRRSPSPSTLATCSSSCLSTPQAAFFVLLEVE